MAALNKIWATITGTIPTTVSNHLRAFKVDRSRRPVDFAAPNLDQNSRTSTYSMLPVPIRSSYSSPIFLGAWRAASTLATVLFDSPKLFRFRYKWADSSVVGGALISGSVFCLSAVTMFAKHDEGDNTAGRSWFHWPHRVTRSGLAPIHRWNSSLPARNHGLAILHPQLASPT